MAVRSSDQISIVDLTDGYSVFMEPSSYTFEGDVDSVAGTQSVTVQITVMQGNKLVDATVTDADIVAPTGTSATHTQNTVRPAEVVITATESCTAAGAVVIPIRVGEVTLNKNFPFSIAFKGQQGQTGETGRSISSTAVTYQQGDSGTTAPTGTWSNSIPTVDEDKYLWTRTVITYTTGSPATTTSYAVAHQGKTGNTGKGINSTAITYQAGTSATAAPTGTWMNNPPAVDEGSFLWTKTVVTYTDNTTSTSYSVAKQGEKGDKGDDAITIAITASNGTVLKNSTGSTTLTAHVYQAGVELTGTALSALGTLKWYKGSSTTAAATGASLTVNASDVTNVLPVTVKLEG